MSACVVAIGRVVLRLPNAAPVPVAERSVASGTQRKCPRTADNQTRLRWESQGKVARANGWGRVGGMADLKNGGCNLRFNMLLTACSG